MTTKGQDPSREEIYADGLLERAMKAAGAFEAFGQEGVDRVVEAVYRAAFDARNRLAEAALEETGIGVLRDKVLKNAFASLIVYRDIRGIPTVGVVREGPDLKEVAHPVGPVVNLTPVTNPTSTVINKALICMKTANPVIFCPHKAARKCSRLAAEICYEAALNAGAPEGCIQWSTKSAWGYTEALMQHRHTALILATTAFHFVREAARMGKPILGAGEGNVPVYVDSSADMDLAAQMITESKTFDHGTVCCSEQALVVTRDGAEAVRKALERTGACFLDRAGVAKLGLAAFDADRGIMRSDVVGRSAAFIAERAGIDVPDGTRLLVAPLDRVGPEAPLSHEILAPILAFYVEADERAALDRCRSINHFHGRGHTLSVHAREAAVAERMARRFQAGRVLINTPSSLGGLGGTYNRLHPSLTLSCGTVGGNYTSDNITVHHLLNISRVAPYRPDAVWLKVPREAWTDPGFDSAALDGLTGTP